MSFHESALFCRLRFALGFPGHVLLALHEVESTSGGYWVHDKCRRPQCPYRTKMKVDTHGFAPIAS